MKERMLLGQGIRDGFVGAVQETLETYGTKTQKRIHESTCNAIKNEKFTRYDHEGLCGRIMFGLTGITSVVEGVYIFFKYYY